MKYNSMRLFGQLKPMAPKEWLPDQQHQHFVGNEYSWAPSRPTKSETLGAVPSNLGVRSPPGGSDACSGLGTTDLSLQAVLSAVTFPGDLAFKLQHIPLFSRFTREGMTVAVLSQSILARVPQVLKASVMIFMLLCSGDKS